MDFSKLSREKFSELCNQLIKAEYPNSKPIEGAGGDEGIDSFVGVFDGDIKVFQYKFFIKPIYNAQKNQIKKSLSQVKKKHPKLKEWVLVIPRDFTPRETRFFIQLQNENSSIKLEYIGLAELRNLLSKYSHIRDEYFKEDKILKELKKQNQKNDEIFDLFKSEASIGKLYSSGWNVIPISVYKFNLINIPLTTLIKGLEKNYQYNKKTKFGFMKFNKITEEKYRTRFIIKKGLINLKIVCNLNDDPFELKYPDYNSTEIWISDITDKLKGIPKIDICVFNSTKIIVDIIKKTFEDCVPSDLVFIENIDFNKTMRRMVNQKFASAIDTLQIEPNITQKAKQESGQDIDVKIKKDTIYGDQNLPRTMFVKRVMKYVKPVKDKGISDILYFKARQSSKLDKGKQITFELHNDGRVRLWFLKKDYSDKEVIKEKASKIIDNLYKGDI